MDMASIYSNRPVVVTNTPARCCQYHVSVCKRINLLLKKVKHVPLILRTAHAKGMHWNCHQNTDAVKNTTSDEAHLGLGRSGDWEKERCYRQRYFASLNGTNRRRKSINEWRYQHIPFDCINEELTRNRCCIFVFHGGDGNAVNYGKEREINRYWDFSRHFCR